RNPHQVVLGVTLTVHRDRHDQIAAASSASNIVSPDSADWPETTNRSPLLWPVIIGWPLPFSCAKLYLFKIKHRL
ncbi:MAG: hypothetical protein ABIP71_14400, partial [Verrucomicrobiota bacterium]